MPKSVFLSLNEILGNEVRPINLSLFTNKNLSYLAFLHF